MSYKHTPAMQALIDKEKNKSLDQLGDELNDLISDFYTKEAEIALLEAIVARMKNDRDFIGSRVSQMEARIADMIYVEDGFLSENSLNDEGDKTI